MRNVHARPLSERSVNQKNVEYTTKSNSKFEEVPIERSAAPIEQLTDRLERVFLDPEVGLVFRFLFRIAQANLSPPDPAEIFLRLALSEAYVRAEKACGRR